MADAIQDPFYKALALEVNQSGWICNAMDQLLGRDTGRLFNDEAAAVAVGAQSPEQATKTIEDSWSKIGFTKDRDNEDYSQAMEGKRPLRRQPENHHFGSLIMLAVTAGAFLLVTWVATKSLFVFVQESPIP